MKSLVSLSSTLFLLASVTSDPPQTPTATDERLVVELVAAEPDIVTPTGVAVDERGRIWVIENQTHQRPKDYKGPAGDRIRIYDDFGAGGRARSIKTFAEGFTNGMGLNFGPSGHGRSADTLYFATRSAIMVLSDSDGDDVADERRVIVRLDTAGDYPHNGLSGFAFDSLDHVYFGFGENLGVPYQLIGSDGTTLSGGGEGGNIYCCRPDGTELTRVATGFWNPFHLTFDAFGRLFAVDNDPDSRPPCRLLHIVPGGDYGYRFRNGRKGLHPFTAWNGELPGTLPMVAGTGEAPSGIVAYESDGLPPEYNGDLIVTSWGDHVIQRFKLRERGASFLSSPETLVRGGENFYPVGIAVAPDGSLVLTDWADKSYPLHGKGRIWRIRMKESPRDDGWRVSKVARLADSSQLYALLRHPKREIRDATTTALAARDDATTRELLERGTRDPNMLVRVHAMWSLARRPNEATYAAIRDRLNDTASEIRGAAAALLGDLTPPGMREEAEAKLLERTRRDPSASVRMQAVLQLKATASLESIVPVLADVDPFVAAAALEVLGRPEHTDLLTRHRGADDPRLRIGVLLALRRAGNAPRQTVIPEFLEDADPAVRRAAIQWVAEERLAEFTLEGVLARGPHSRELFEAFLVAQQLLAGITRTPTDEPSGEDLVVRILSDPVQPLSVQSWALYNVRPDHPALTTAVLKGYLGRDKRQEVRIPALLALGMRPDAESQAVLRAFAADSAEKQDWRALAIVGLAQSAAESPETRRFLLEVLRTGSMALGRSAMQSLRAAAPTPQVSRSILEWWERNHDSEYFRAAATDLEEELLFALRSASDDDAAAARLPESIAAAAERRPKGLEEWIAELKRPGDELAGQFVFFRPRGLECVNCHRIKGRGGLVGPDLSTIGRTLDRNKLVRSLLEPSKDIAPQYATWLVATRDGRVHTGVILHEDPRGALALGDAQGKIVEIRVADIEERRAEAHSIMPTNLIDQLTRQEFRDLVEFLSSLK